ncbi:hypothetical protein FHETE_2021 [Fusarium heterosporum]|uniref:RRM domain-containing protein n=1 Tax=Fusarium heterosporum TaxID=42747 RepID=A0A8H5TUE8_FUSHE|nr:hypothetical protein FHETE_2021 [Fusarium heterosporum]
MPTENTVQADVGPGDETGIYYITICNLPFGTSWQQLKDWTRTACVVDHIEVFQSSTSGWVRVRGRENFERAWGLLNGGVFHGRSIIASDKNRFQSIKIRELAIPPQGIQPQTPQYLPTPSQYVQPMPAAISPHYSTSPGQYYSVDYPQTSDLRFSAQPIPSQGYTLLLPITVATTIPVTHGVIGPRRHYIHNEDATQAFAVKANAVAYSPPYHHQETQFALPYRGLDEHPSYYADCSLTVDESPYRSEYVLTEPRKLHVSPFPQQARADEVKSWIRRKVDKTKIVSMEIPKNSNSRYLRGYVLVIFDSVSAANIAIDQLNKARFQGRRVIARPTSEGAAMEEPSGSYEASSQVESKSDEVLTPTGPSRHRNGDGLKGEKPQRPKIKETRSTDSEKRKGSEKSHSSKKVSGSQTDKKSSSRKTPDQGPVIVDGTCHRHGKH